MAATPAGGASSAPVSAAPRAGLVNFTGNWLMDVSASDSLEPLLAYHGLPAAPAADAAAATGTADTASAGQPANGVAPDANAAGASVTLITTTASSDGQLQQTTQQSQAATPTPAPVQATADGSRAAAVTPPNLLTTELMLGASTPSTGSTSGSLPTVNEDSRRNSTADSPDAHAAAATSTPAVATPAAASTRASSAPASASASAPAPPAAVPALIVQHNVRKLTTFLHGLIPRYGPNGQLMRYDPAIKGKLAVHEEYRLDGQYHTVTTPRGRVEARAYHAPHGQSLVVDTRCASKYDLERTERFLEDGGKRLVIEIRILSCAPQIQADAATPASSGVSSRFAAAPSQPQKAIAPSQLVVKELLFLRRVFKRIIDADPKAAASPAPRTPASASASASGAGPAAAGAAAQQQGGLLDFESAVGHQSSLRLRAAGTAGDAAASHATLLRSQLSPTALAILPAALTASASPALHSLMGALSALFYPRHVLLRRYPLADIAAGTVGTAADGSAALPAALAEAVTREHAAYQSARSQMTLVDVALAALLLLLLLRHTGLLSATAPWASV